MPPQASALGRQTSARTPSGISIMMSAMGGKGTLAPKAQRLDQQREGRRVVTAARVIEVVAGERRGPVLKHPHQATLAHPLLDFFLGQESESKAVEHRLAHQVDAVEGQLAFDPDPDLAAVFFELPRVESAGRGLPVIDAIMLREVARRARPSALCDIGG